MKQTFHLKYEHLPKAEALCERLRREIATVAGVDTSRRFYIFLKQFRETDIEFEIEVHFRGSSGALLRERRQSVLLKIGSVVHDMGAEWAVWNGVLEGGPNVPTVKPPQ